MTDRSQIFEYVTMSYKSSNEMTMVLPVGVLNNKWIFSIDFGK